MLKLIAPCNSFIGYVGTVENNLLLFQRCTKSSILLLARLSSFKQSEDTYFSVEYDVLLSFATFLQGLAIVFNRFPNKTSGGIS